MKNLMQRTQLEAYYQLPLNPLEEQMITFYRRHPKASYTDIMLAEQLCWSLSCVCGRRNSLVKKGILEKDGCIRNPESGKRNILWRLRIK